MEMASLPPPTTPPTLCEAPISPPLSSSEAKAPIKHDTIDLACFDQFKPIPDAPPITDSRDNAVALYPITNEANSWGTYILLKLAPVIGRSLVTISGIHGLHQFATRKREVDHCFHIDPNPLQKMFWDILITSIQTSDTAEIAKQQILTKFKVTFPAPDLNRKLKCYFSDDSHLLSEPAYWNKLKSAACSGRIVSLSINLQDTGKYKAFCTALKVSKLWPDTLYVSNLSAEKWLGNRRVTFLIETMMSVHPELRLYVIRAGNTGCVCLRGSLSQSFLLHHAKDEPFEFKETCSKGPKHYIQCIHKIQRLLIYWYTNSVRRRTHVGLVITARDKQDWNDYLTSIQPVYKEFTKKLSSLYKLLVVSAKFNNILKELLATKEVFPEEVARYEGGEDPKTSPLLFTIKAVVQPILYKLIELEKSTP